MYDGLPIITNKITTDERKGVPHHLLACVNLKEPTWTVAKFVPEALRIIKEIRNRGRLPILVGGTHYYIQSLLIQESLIDNDGEAYEESISAKIPILEEPTEVILARLREVDPVMANRWHPGDRRRIQRSLEIYLNTGKRASDIYASQNLPTPLSDTDGSPVKVPQSSLRFEPLVFWMYAPNEVLHPRLDGRVLEMMKTGLLDEVASLSDLRTSLETEIFPLDVTRGIWISIGYKEVEQYEIALRAGESDETLERLKQEAIDRIQTSTRQYAKQQIRWIQSKFITAMTRASADKSIFLLDGSDVSQWDAQVSTPAVEVASKFLEGANLPDPMAFAGPYQDKLQPRGLDLPHNRELWENKTCDVCNVVATTEDLWQKHIQSNRHNKALASRRKWLKFQELQASGALPATPTKRLELINNS